MLLPATVDLFILFQVSSISFVHVLRRLQSVALGLDPREIQIAMVVVVVIAVMIGAVVVIAVVGTCILQVQDMVSTD